MTTRQLFTPLSQPWWFALAWMGLWLCSPNAPGKDWPQWGGSNARNMVSEEKGLPDSFVPGEKDPQAGRIMMERTKNVKWATKLCQAIYSTPVVAMGKIFIGGRQLDVGLLMCLDEKTGKLLWQW